MNKFGLLIGAMLSMTATSAFGQIENSIKLNEVMTNNATNLQDEYGQHDAWVEIANISHSTYNIRGMYITTDRSVLDPKMSVPERIKRMTIIPSGDPRTMMSGRQHLVFYCNSNPAKGTLHLALPVKPGEPVWIALYNGNAVNLLDSVTVPALEADQSFARHDDGAAKWEVKPADAVTPAISNYIKVSESKVAKIKRQDPNGFGITVLSMGIVFFCLALLFVFFSIFGVFMKRRSTAKQTAAQPAAGTASAAAATAKAPKDGAKIKEGDRDVYIAVISMALKQYLDDIHDVESGIITIKPKNTDWNYEYIQMTHFHE